MDTHRQRRSPRLQGYDYAQEGAYFVTICAHDRACLFGAVIDDVMVLNRAGSIAYEELTRIPRHWDDTVDIDVFVVMPNHIHAIILIVGTPFSASTTNIHTDAQKRVPTLGQIVGNYKSGVTRRIHEQCSGLAGRVWQSRYHDHIIRCPADLHRIQAYVINNPARWQADTFYAPSSP